MIRKPPAGCGPAHLPAIGLSALYAAPVSSQHVADMVVAQGGVGPDRFDQVMPGDALLKGQSKNIDRFLGMAPQHMGPEQLIRA